MNNLELLELVIAHLSEFADITYVKNLRKLVKDSEYNNLTPVLDKIINYYEINKIFPSKKYFIEKWKINLDDTPFLIEYASEIIAKLRTSIIYNQVKEKVSGEEPSGTILQDIQSCLYKYTPENKNKNFDSENIAEALENALNKKKKRGAGLLTYTSIDKYTYGCPFGATTVIGAKAKTGKALRNGTKIITSNGMVSIENLKVGDIVYDMDGKPTKVLGVYPQGKKQLYKVIFNDNSYEYCCKEHLWTTHDYHDRCHHRPWKVVNTETMMKSVKFIKSGDKSVRANYSIPLVGSVEFGKKDLKIHPYVIGCLLGDGVISGSMYGLSNTDTDVIDKFFNLLYPNYVKGALHGCTTNIKMSDDTKVSFKTLLDSIGVGNHKAKDKFIPENYLFSSIDDRIQLLQGLMDTDGSVSKKSRTQYSYWTISPKLRDDVVALVKSLGGTAQWRAKKTVCSYKNQKVDCDDTYEIKFSFPKNDIIPVTCERKLSSICVRKHRVQEKYIHSIEPAMVDNATCIEVDSPTHTYVTENYTVTHNTQVALSIAWGAITKQNLKGIYISLEISEETIYQRLFSRYMYDQGIYIDNKDIIKGTLNEKDEKIYLDNLKAFEETVKNKICVVTQENLPELNKAELETFLIRKDQEMGGIDFVIVDQVSLLKYFSGITYTSGKDKTFDIINAYIRYFTIASFTLFKKPVAMILLSQIKRDSYNTIDARKPVSLDCFAESSELERSCNIAVVLRLDDQLKQSNLLEMVLVVNRDGDNCEEYTPNVCIPKHCYIGSLDNSTTIETTTQDVGSQDTSSLFKFMEDNDSDDLDDLFN